MASYINTNIASLNSQRALSSSQNTLQTSLQRLSSGLRINSAKDDSAGMAISTRMTAQINGMNQASRNANDAISMSQTAEGAMGSINDILLRMRDLSVQAANGSNGDKERASIQNEVDQLYAEIDRISSTTNFNGVKLLDGSVKNTQFQVGADANQTISFSIGEVSTSSLKLGGTSSGLGDLNSGRIKTSAAPATGDLSINGTTIAFKTTDKSAAAYKDAINANSATTGVTASAYNSVTGKTHASGEVASGGLTIAVGGNTAISVSAAKDMDELVKNINSQVAGVTASINKDGALVLSNETGEKITVAGTDDGAASGLKNGTYEGYLTLSSTNNSKITLGGNKLDTFGFNASVGRGSVTGSATVTTEATGGDLLAAASAAVAALNSGTTGAVDDDADKVTINGIALDTNAIKTAFTAADKANAINALKDKTGVTATATTTAYLDLSANDITGDLTINGNSYAIGSVDSMVTAINLARDAGNSGGISAEKDVKSGKLVLTSSTGQDIVISSKNAATDAGILISDSVDGTNQELKSAYGAIGVRGKINLTSANGEAVKIEDGTTGGTGLAKLGLVSQGGTAEAILGKKLSVSTQAGAQEAIDKIDKAIDNIANQRATMGAVQNRFSSTISNLATSVENISASRSRIQDADFAAETANMTRAQILQQAGTAMLAQANSLPNGVLSLLRG